MFRSKYLFTSLLAVLLALALFPFSALALTENSLESAPEISLPEEDDQDMNAEAPEGNGRDDDSFRPSPAALPERGTMQESEELELPRLTDAELAVTRELLAGRSAGESAESGSRHYANAEKVFDAGVYPLDPEEFGGNTFYVILPYRQMNRNELASLIAAFEELGIGFDPDSLNSTNCVRGTSLLYNSATRSLSPDEQNRMEEIRKLVRRGILDRDAFTPEASCRSVQVQLPGYSGSSYDYLEPFCFYPYRAMADSELATFALAQEATWEVHPDQLEKKARQYAHKLLPLPLSMTAYDESRYAYSEDFIEFRNFFRIESENSGVAYASPEETPCDVWVEQQLCSEQGSFPAEASVARILADYPAMYDSQAGGRPKCSEEELKAAARRWAEKYLLIPEKDILSDWVFDGRSDDWGTATYRLLTTDWLVCLEMYEINARYCQCCIYNREFAVEFDDWNLNAPEQNGTAEAAGTGETAKTEETAGAGEQAWGIEPDAIDRNARQEAGSLLHLPQDINTDSVTRNEDGYLQYRTDYSFSTGEKAGEGGSPDRQPSRMIVYQKPYFTETTSLRVECLFLSYPSESGGETRLSDEEYRAAARKWAEKTLRIPMEEITADWTYNPMGTEGTVVYQLETNEWTVYLQMYMNGDCCWSGFYHRNISQ